MKIYKIIACCAIAAFLLTGCSNGENLKDLSVVEGMGIDYTEKGINVTVQSLNLAKEGNGAEALSGNITMNTFGDGKNISAAVQKVAESLSKKLFFGQNQILVLGSELARSNLSDSFDYLLRSSDSRPDVAVCISDGKASAAMESKQNDALVPAQAISQLLENGEKNGFAAYVTVNEMLNLYKDKTSDIYLPVITPTDENVTVSGIAVYSGERLANILPDSQIMGFLLLTDKIDEGYFEFEDEQYGKIGVEIISSSTKTKAYLKNGAVVFDVDIDVQLSMEELENGVEAAVSEQELKSIAHSAEEKLKEKCAEAFDSCVLYSSDCLRIGENLAKNSPADYAALSDDWGRNISKTVLDVSCSSKLKIVNENARGY